MDYIPKPSLEHIALVKVAATLWNQHDVKTLLAGFHSPSNYRKLNENWMKIESLVVKNVEKLPLPKQIKEKISCFIRPVGIEISKWKFSLEKHCNLRVNLPNEFCWSPQGTIDRKKTAEGMIKIQNIGIATRYKLACIYCLEDDILKLWAKIPEDCRKSFYSQEDPKLVNQKELVVFWTYLIKGKMKKMNRMIEKSMVLRRLSHYQYAFEVAVGDNNRVASEYFFQKLTAAEREESLVKCAMSVLAFRRSHFINVSRFLEKTYSHTLCFLFSKLNEEQQIELFKSYPQQFLTCFLDWPMQIFFTETYTRMRYFLNKHDYGKILLCIIDKIKHGCKDFNYQKLFGEFWKQSLDDNERHVLSTHWEILLHIVSVLFEMRDEDNIRLIFEDVTVQEKKYLIYADMGLICKNLMNDKKQLSLLKYFIKECLPSKDEVIEFKQALAKGTLQLGNFYNKFKFRCVLNEVICEFKRKK